ncbi:hypothetical protein JTE90_027316 [Oedothorax gibbosus]|uniref:Uncharacterized protein n=1 Tax=Oedothorax gibbosus TaxID=931172 RepID=A0AAV6W4B8_9ARAC|nr:hypothetical protein JTE90_027316 [Oedothorax gibbosus]
MAGTWRLGAAETSELAWDYAGGQGETSIQVNSSLTGSAGISLSDHGGRFKLHGWHQCGPGIEVEASVIPVLQTSLDVGYR